MVNPPSLGGTAAEVNRPQGDVSCAAQRPGAPYRGEPKVVNRLMEKLSTDFTVLTDQYETILNRCADEERDPTDSEAANLVELRSQMEPLGDRLVELKET